MQLKQGLVLRKVDGQAVVVPVGALSRTFQGMLRLNESAEVLFETLAAGACTPETLTAALTERYEVSEAQAAEDVVQFVKVLRDAGLLEE